jgi:hypothetical protein
VDKKHWINPEERIEYYLNHHQSIKLNLNALKQVKQRTFWTKTDVNYFSFSDFKGSLAHWYCKHLMHLPLLRELRALPFYKSYRDLHTLIDFFQPFDALASDIEDVKFPIFYGESGATDSLPIIRKARHVEDNNAVLFDFRSLRYNSPCLTVDKNDKVWSKKSNGVVWRGATTGEGLRENFVESYFEKYDIGFSTVKQKPHLARYIKKRISVSEQLNYKFIVSLQGNDLASNIRWALFSNSVLVMPKPLWTSWTMEEKLIPYVHYLPLNDELTNLDEILTWAAENDTQCQEIAQNGKQYVTQFLDRKYNTEVKMMFLKEYAKRLEIIE